MATGYANDLALGANFGLGDPVKSIETVIASATTITPLSSLTILTGTAQVQNINIPWPGFAGSIDLLFVTGSPGATLTGGTAGIAIAVASTVLVNVVLRMTYSQIKGLWYPSY